MRPGECPFEQSGGREMPLKMRAVDHHAVGRAALGRKVGEDLVENTTDQTSAGPPAALE
jgi:hypothetical protein